MEPRVGRRVVAVRDGPCGTGVPDFVREHAIAADFVLFGAAELERGIPAVSSLVRPGDALPGDAVAVLPAGVRTRGQPVSIVHAALSRHVAPKGAKASCVAHVTVLVTGACVALHTRLHADLGVHSNYETSGVVNAD